jgi:Rieske Fe-S protein
LKCIVRWDGFEKSWDCPCHGSRFDALGRVLNGPAISDLEELENEIAAPGPVVETQADLSSHRPSS